MKRTALTITSLTVALAFAAAPASGAVSTKGKLVKGPGSLGFYQPDNEGAWDLPSRLEQNQLTGAKWIAG